MNRKDRRVAERTGKGRAPGARSDIDQAFAAALDHHGAGRLREAEDLYRQIVAADPRHSNALHYLGILAHQMGHSDDAVALIGEAIAPQRSRARLSLQSAPSH
jgi:cytochrome c-type biogenesis protein CcmH/NrfG